MCRFVAYLGHQDLLMDALLAKPDHSLIKQSHEAREGAHGINADGFGLAWYQPTITPEPGLFKSTQPAWNDHNLMHLCHMIQSGCFLGHIRSSTVGDVSLNNCHPFAFETYAFVHNGTIRNFDAYRKRLIDYIDEDLFLSIRGNTDSECFFFLIMHFIRRTKNLTAAVLSATDWVVQIEQDQPGFSRLNIVITDGQELMATRFASKGEKPLSLVYTTHPIDGKYHPSLILSSEPLHDHAWNELPENHYLTINKNTMQLQSGPVMFGDHTPSHGQKTDHQRIK